jgi:hypothetical protein
VRTLAMETYGPLLISTHLAVDDGAPWDCPSMILQIDNGFGRRVRIRFNDPDALNYVATAIRNLQDDYRRYVRLTDVRLHTAS